MAHVQKILISGAGIAGPALGFWLARYGFDVTIIERANEPRSGGHAVDFRGVAMEVLARMGLLDAVQQAATHMGDMDYIDAAGKIQATLPANFASGEVEIMRGDLVDILHQATRGDVRYVFGDYIEALNQHEDGVSVSFANDEAGLYDLVIGADGQHSGVRRLAFGPEADFAQNLGIYVAVAKIPNFLKLDRRGKMFNAPGTIVSYYPARHNSEARAMFFFHAEDLDIDYRDTQKQKAVIAARYRNQGWAVPRLVDEMLASEDFYFDNLVQIQLPAWSVGRVGLLGDSAFCATPLSGMGTGMAITGAYMLAQELQRTPDDYANAFARYQTRLTPFVTASQKLAQMSTSGYVPKTAFGIQVRNWITRLVSLLPGQALIKPAIDAANSVTLD